MNNYNYTVLALVLASAFFMLPNSCFGQLPSHVGILPVCNPLDKECDGPFICCPNLICSRFDDTSRKTCMKCREIGMRCSQTPDCCHPTQPTPNLNEAVDCVRVGEDPRNMLCKIVFQKPPPPK